MSVGRITGSVRVARSEESRVLRRAAEDGEILCILIEGDHVEKMAGEGDRQRDGHEEQALEAVRAPYAQNGLIGGEGDCLRELVVGVSGGAFTPHI